MGKPEGKDLYLPLHTIQERCEIQEENIFSKSRYLCLIPVIRRIEKKKKSLLLPVMINMLSNSNVPKVLAIELNLTSYSDMKNGLFILRGLLKRGREMLNYHSMGIDS